MLMHHTISAVSIFESSPPWASRPFSPWWPLISVHSQSSSQIRLPRCSRPLTSPAAFHSDDLRDVSAASLFTPSSPWSPWFPLILFLEHLSRHYCSVTFSKSRFELCDASSAPKPSMVSCSLQNSALSLGHCYFPTQLLLSSHLPFLLDFKTDNPCHYQFPPRIPDFPVSFQKVCGLWVGITSSLAYRATKLEAEYW